MGERTELDTTVHPPIVHHLHLQFNGWLGDDLLETFPCFTVTEWLRRAIEKFSFSGCEFDVLEVSTSEMFEELYPNRRLPIFHWLKVFGAPGHDDFGMLSDARLVVSALLLECLRRFNLQQCDIGAFTPSSE